MAIIRYHIEAKAKTRDAEVMASGWQYEEVSNPHKAGKLISKKEAQERIEAQGLILVYSDKNGAVWDSPDEPMLEKYGGTFSHLI